MKLKSFSLKAVLAGTLLISSVPTAFAQTREQHNESARLNNQALELGKEGRHEEALQLYNQSIALEEDQIALYNRSFAFYRLERYDEALKDINKVLSRGTANLKALSQRATIYSAQGNDAAAFDDLTQMLTLEPDNISYAIRRGSTALDAEKYVPALDSYYYAETLAQKQAIKEPTIEKMHKSIPGRVGLVYALLGLPYSTFTTNKSASLNDAFVTNFKPKPNELRFDGICSSVNTKTGVFSFDTLSVSFPNGKTKVLPQPKRKVAQLKGVKIQNAHNKTPSPLKVGDFVVVTGKDNGKVVLTRALAQGIPHEHTDTEAEEAFDN